jgi:hypothetical protein
MDVHMVGSGFVEVDAEVLKEQQEKEQKLAEEKQLKLEEAKRLEATVDFVASSSSVVVPPPREQPTSIVGPQSAAAAASMNSSTPSSTIMQQQQTPTMAPTATPVAVDSSYKLEQQQQLSSQKVEMLQTEPRFDVLIHN